MALGAVLVVWWLLAAATGPEDFSIVDGLLTSWVGHLVLLGVTWALAYHLLNGIRHLFWDMGYGYELETVDKTGWAVVIGSAVLTVLLWLVA